MSRIAGADRRVGLRQPHAFVDRARRVADGQPDVPQHVEDIFGELFAERRLLVGQHEQEVDVGPRRQRGAPVTADRDQRQPLALRQVVDPEHALHREVVDGADDRIHVVGQPLRAGDAAAVLEQLCLGVLALSASTDFEMREHIRAHGMARAVAAMLSAMAISSARNASRSVSGGIRVSAAGMMGPDRASYRSPAAMSHGLHCGFVTRPFSR
jgi:hypothetical protein